MTVQTALLDNSGASLVTLELLEGTYRVVSYSANFPEGLVCLSESTWEEALNEARKAVGNANRFTGPLPRQFFAQM